MLMDLGWRVWEDEDNMDEDIIDQSRSDCGAEPEGTILVLITKDGDFADMIEELRAKGVRVYLMAPRDASDDLVEAVGDKRWIPLDAPLVKPNASRQSAFGQVARPVGYPVQYSYGDFDDDD